MAPAEEFIENGVFDDIAPGQPASLTWTLTERDIELPEHCHAAAETAARLAHKGEVHALMKGSLHSDEFLHPVLEHANGLRTDRRLSHVFLMDVPDFDRPLFITDGAASRAAVKAKHIVSEVAGQADLLVAPDLEAGNMIAEQLDYLADADAAGIMHGGPAFMWMARLMQAADEFVTEEAEGASHKQGS